MRSALYRVCLLVGFILTFLLLLAVNGHCQSGTDLIPTNKIFWHSKTYIVQIRAGWIVSPACGGGIYGAVTHCTQGYIEFSQAEQQQEAVRDYMYHELEHIVTECAEDDHTSLHRSIYALVPVRELLADKRNRSLAKWLFTIP
jgi:hypothetical protein